MYAASQEALIRAGDMCETCFAELRRLAKLDRRCELISRICIYLSIL